MVEDVRIRPATVREMRELLRLWRELVGYHEALGGQDFRLAAGAEKQWQAFLRLHIRAKDRIGLVADRDGAPVGFPWVP